MTSEIFAWRKISISSRGLPLNYNRLKISSVWSAAIIFIKQHVFFPRKFGDFLRRNLDFSAIRHRRIADSNKKINRNEAKRSSLDLFDYFLLILLFIFLWYSWYASQFIKKKRTALLHPCTSGAVRLTPSNRFARFPTEWQTLFLTKRFPLADYRLPSHASNTLFQSFKSPSTTHQPHSLTHSLHLTC